MKGLRIFLMADYKVGWQVARYLKQRGEHIVGLAVHPPRIEGNLNRGYTKKIIQELELPKGKIFDADDLKKKTTLDRIKALKPDIMLVVFWAFMIDEELIRIPRLGCVNFHAGLLPYNRGANPNVWPFIDGTPAGISIHYINTEIDAGPLIAQQEVSLTSVDTAATLYRKLINAFLPLFKKAWPMLKKGTVASKAPSAKGTLHYRKDLKQLDVIDLAKTYTAKDLINRLRARTFPPHPSSYFIDENGKKIFIRIQLEYETE